MKLSIFLFAAESQKIAIVERFNFFLRFFPTLLLFDGNKMEIKQNATFAQNQQEKNDKNDILLILIGIYLQL